MSAFETWLASGLVIGGLLILTLAVYGMFRMPDLYTRLHAVSKSVFLGVIPLLLAAALTGDGAIIARAVLIGAFLLLTTPVSSHVIARAGYLTREPLVGPPAAEAKDEDGPLPRPLP